MLGTSRRVVVRSEHAGTWRNAFGARTGFSKNSPGNKDGRVQYTSQTITRTRVTRPSHPVLLMEHRPCVDHVLLKMNVSGRPPRNRYMPDKGEPLFLCYGKAYSSSGFCPIVSAISNSGAILVQGRRCRAIVACRIVNQSRTRGMVVLR